MKTKIIAVLTGLLACVTSIVKAEGNVTIRFGHFPNVTHAQGVIAHALSRQGKGWFEERLGPGQRAPAPGDLLLQLDHAQIPLGLVVVERHPQVVQ